MSNRFIATPTEAECNAGTFRLSNPGAGLELAVHSYAIRGSEAFGPFGLMITMARSIRPDVSKPFVDLDAKTAANHLGHLADFLFHNYPYHEQISGLKVMAESVIWNQDIVTPVVAKFKSQFPNIKLVNFHGHELTQGAQK